MGEPDEKAVAGEVGVAGGKEQKTKGAVNTPRSRAVVVLSLEDPFICVGI